MTTDRFFYLVFHCHRFSDMDYIYPT